MEFNVQSINDFIKNARKTLLIIIAVIFMLIFIRGCINQITFYKEDIAYLQVIFKYWILRFWVMLHMTLPFIEFFEHFLDLVQLATLDHFMNSEQT